jgi:hypothetical protein
MAEAVKTVVFKASDELRFACKYGISSKLTQIEARSLLESAAGLHCFGGV